MFRNNQRFIFSLNFVSSSWPSLGGRGWKFWIYIMFLDFSFILSNFSFLYKYVMENSLARSLSSLVQLQQCLFFFTILFKCFNFNFNTIFSWYLIYYLYYCLNLLFWLDRLFLLISFLEFPHASGPLSFLCLILNVVIHLKNDFL